MTCPDSCISAVREHVKDTESWLAVVYICGGQEDVPFPCWGCTCHWMMCTTSKGAAPPTHVQGKDFLLWCRYPNDMYYFHVIHHVSRDNGAGVRGFKRPAPPAKDRELEQEPGREKELSRV